MKHYRILDLLLVLFIFGLIAGCSSDKSSEPKEEAPQFVPKTISVPQNMQQSSDPMAQMAMNHIMTANAMSNFASFFTPPPLLKTSDALGATDWEKKWDQDGMTITLTATENDTGYQWEVKLDGTSQSSGITYSNFIFLRIEQNKNGTAGKFTLYDFENNTTDILMEWVWNTLPGDIFDFVGTFYDNGVPEAKIKIISNPDNSGELYFFEYINGTFVLEFKAAWTASGSGEWWTYDENGNIVNQGSWS